MGERRAGNGRSSRAALHAVVENEANMRSSFASRGGPLLKTTNYRERAQRRRITILAAMLGLALGSAAIGAFATRHEATGQTGPFSYFPI